MIATYVHPQHKTGSRKKKSMMLRRRAGMNQFIQRISILLDVSGIRKIPMIRRQRSRRQGWFPSREGRSTQ
jgi:hypothetical protein